MGAEMTLPPHNLTSEYSVLGSLLFEPSIYWRLEDILTEADFFDPLHGDVFAACRDLMRDGRAVNSASVSDRMRASEALKAIGGEGWLADLLEYEVSAFEAADHAGLIAKASQKRRLMAAGRDLVALAAEDADAALEAHETALEAIRERQASHMAVESCADGEVFAESEQDSLLVSGFKRLDDEIRGFERGALSIIAARPGVGKTAFAIAMAANIARHETVGFLSLDMQGKVIKQRLACCLYFAKPGFRRTPSVADLKEPGKVSSEVMDEMRQTLRGDTGRRILVNDRGGQTTRTVAGQVRAWHRHCRKMGLPQLGAVFIDHIAKVAPAQKAGGLYEKTSYAANELLDIAKANPNTAIIALCQLNRDVEKSTRRPIISDLRDSGKVEEDASLVLLLHREDMRWALAAKTATSPEDRQKANAELLKVKGDFEIVIGKNRNGEQGAVTLWHSMAHNAVRDLRSAGLEEVA
jgi:replicative DNA helicase